MATTVTYKNNTLVTVNNQTKTLKTAGKFLEDDITLVDVSGGTAAISVVDTADTAGGNVRTITALDISDTTAVAGDVAQGKYFYTADGTKTAGTASGGGGGSGYTLTNIIPLQTAACTTNLMNNAYYAFINILSEPQTGHMYLVTMDGTEYVCEGYKSEYSTTLGRYTEGLGDMRIAGTYLDIVLSVPFYMAFEAGDNYYVVRGSGTHTIKVDEIVLLDGGTTLGTKTITANGTYDADDDNLDGYSSVTVNVGGGATQHTIHLEFDDSTDADIDVDYDDSWIGSLITSTRPQTYGLKTINSAALDNTVWYQRTIIPLNTQLVDYTACTLGYAIGSDGEPFENEWSYITDYIAVDPSMTFSYTCYYWYYVACYDDSYNLVRTIYAMTDSTADENDGNIGHGTLSGNELLGVYYVRLCGYPNNSDKMSLIRTA